MWTSQNRARYDRSKLRYPSDLTDDEWGLVEPLIPPGKTGGGKRRVIMREVVNGLMYILSTGCQWRAIPNSNSKSMHLVGYHSIFWIFISSGGMVKVARAWRKTVQEGKTA